MIVDLQKVITGIAKKPVEDSEGPLNLKRALLLALITPNPDSKGAKPEEALKTRRLFDKIDVAEASVDLKSEEVVKLKEVLAARLSELIAGAAIELLEPPEKTDAVPS